MAKPPYLDKSGKVVLTESEWATVEGDGTQENPFTVILDGTNKRVRLTGSIDTSDKKGLQFDNVINGVTLSTTEKPNLSLYGDTEKTSGNFDSINKEGAAAALALGITEVVLNAFPELRPIFDKFALGDIAEARLDYYNSNYFKNLSGTAQGRQTKQKTQPGVYAQEFDDWKQKQKRRLTDKGFMITPEIEAMFEASYLKGDSDVQLEIAILNSGKMGTKIGGSTLGTVNALKSYADDQGVNTILPKNYWDKVSMGILDGTMTDESIQEELKGFAVSAFPAYAKGIEGGRSFGLQTSALRQTIANILEVDVDTVTNDNPVFKQLVGYINPKTQTPEIVPLWEAEKIIKSRDEWLYTKNARQTFDDLGLRVFRDMGLA
jgi:hypothetical protein